MVELFGINDKMTIFESYNMVDVECATIFEALPHDNGYVMVVYLNNISPEELNDFAVAQIQVGLMFGEKGFVNTLLSVGNSMEYEMSFDPTLYSDKRALQLIHSNNQLTLVLVESESVEIKAIRKHNIPINLANHWWTNWKKAMEINKFSTKYSKWIESLQCYRRNNWVYVDEIVKL